MNSIDAERNKVEESPEDFYRRHDARQYRPGYFTGVYKCIGCDEQWTEGEVPKHAFGCGAAHNT